jgi:hypothetical protein
MTPPPTAKAELQRVGLGLLAAAMAGGEEQVGSGRVFALHCHRSGFHFIPNLLRNLAALFLKRQFFAAERYGQAGVAVEAAALAVTAVRAHGADAGVVRAGCHALAAAAEHGGVVGVGLGRIVALCCRASA